jgi:hypothetical protein
MKPFEREVNFAGSFIFLCIAFVFLTAKTEIGFAVDSVLDLPIISSENEKAREFHVEVSCSEIKPRTLVATLKWKGAKNIFARQRLDATIHKGGFKKDAFTSLWPIKSDQKFQSISKVKNSNLSVSKSLYLNTVKADFDPEKETASVKLEGLEPGVNYFWRILTLVDEKGWISGAVVRTNGIICPADIVNEKK